MPKTVIMPALGMAQETGTLVRWLKAAGDPVKQGEPLAEIMTDKATVELESPADGTLSQVTASEGAEVPVGQTIALILVAGEAPQSSAPRASTAPPATPAALASEQHAMPSPSPPSPPSPQSPQSLPSLPSLPSPGLQAAPMLTASHDQRAPVATAPRLRAASPKARRIAAERGIELAAIAGSGPRGVVLAADVLAAVTAMSSHATANLAPTAAVPAPPAADHDGAFATPVSGPWRLVAQRTTRSWQEAPQFFVAREVNASQLVAWRARMRQHTSERVTYSDLLIKLVATALRRHPRLNASWQADAILTHTDINIGLAIATEDGLSAPVVHRADQLSLPDIARRRAELIERAQAGRLHPDDVTGGTFTISNLGMYDVDAFSAIVVPPQAGILAVGRIAERVVPLHGVPTVQPMLWLHLSCDHRVVDGARAAQFLSTLADVIEAPLLLLT